MFLYYGMLYVTVFFPPVISGPILVFPFQLLASLPFYVLFLNFLFLYPVIHQVIDSVIPYTMSFEFIYFSFFRYIPVQVLIALHLNYSILHRSKKYFNCESDHVTPLPKPQYLPLLLI